MELTIHALSHSYGDKKALTGFTHTFAPGITALLGPNGAGKSTLIHLICDLLPRQTGTIAFDGTDILSMGPAFRQVLGFMPQSQGMYDDMTAWEFLLYMAQLKGLRPRAAREQLRELLQVVNLWDAAHRRVGGFSGGMRQRVMLAQALLGAPKVLLLDEPTAGLDPEERIHFRNLFAQEAKDKLVLLSTHIIEDVQSVCDRLIVIHGGELLFDGRPEQLVARAQGHVGVFQGYPPQGISCEVTAQVNTAGGILCRAVAEKLPETVQKVEPTLEDAYVYLVGKEGKRP
jgi:ABC-2 type transport system ATP-binding protein